MATKGSISDQATPHLAHAINVLISGTPGVGKSTHAAELSTRLGLKYINVNDTANEQGLYEGWDSELESKILDEESVVDAITADVKKGGCVVEYHSCDLFPKAWFHIVFVLRTDNTILYDRLAKRGYNEMKMKNNIECEIFQELLEEAREHFGLEKVIELYSNHSEDIEKNLDVMVGVIKGMAIKD